MSEIEFKEKKTGDGDIPEIICIICPNSCRLSVYKDEKGEIQVLNALCKRGIEYGKQEFLFPKRLLITTMQIKNGTLPVIPVRSDVELPKDKIMDAIKVVNDTVINAPIKVGEILIDNILDLDVNVISSRSMKAKYSSTS
jgi:CxxC motif-containing protein